MANEAVGEEEEGAEEVVEVAWGMEEYDESLKVGRESTLEHGRVFHVECLK